MENDWFSGLKKLRPPFVMSNSILFFAILYLYVISPSDFLMLHKNWDIIFGTSLGLFKYCDKNGNTNQDSNPNGSLENIAGIFNTKKNILGMMPHPERMVEKILTGNDGLGLFLSLMN